MLKSEDTKKLWSLIKDVKVGMLVSHDDTHLRARPMHITQDEFDGTLYFFTKRKSDKVAEIKKDHDVCVAFSGTDEDSYVSCSGVANIIRDQDLINDMWNPFVGAWFPEGKEDPNVALIKIDVYMAEIWDTDKSDMVQLYEIAKANLTDSKPDMGENKKFG